MKKKIIKKRPSFMPARCHIGFGPPADLGPGLNPLADMDPPLQIWTPLPNFPYEHRLNYNW